MIPISSELLPRLALRPQASIASVRIAFYIEPMGFGAAIYFRDGHYQPAKFLRRFFLFSVIAPRPKRIDWVYHASSAGQQNVTVGFLLVLYAHSAHCLMDTAILCGLHRDLNSPSAPVAGVPAGSAPTHLLPDFLYRFVWNDNGLYDYGSTVTLPLKQARPTLRP